MNLTVTRATASLSGELTVPGDKSMSHRALLLGALAEGQSEIRGFCPSADCLSTLSCLLALGVQVRWEGSCALVVLGRGLQGLVEPEDVLNAGNSATTMRLLCGILAGQPFYSVLTGDPSLRRRPMDRVAEPLSRMGATVIGRDHNRFPPLTILGHSLSPVGYTLPVPSAQVKSALLLAGLYANGKTVVREPLASRDHTERMLQLMGASIATRPGIIQIDGKRPLRPMQIAVPGDLSSAAFLLVAAAIVPGSSVTLRDVGINPTRTGVLEVLQEMGADLTVDSVREASNEPVGSLHIESSPLKAVHIGGERIPRLIDELPILAVAATQAEGVTVIRDARELRAKETDRIRAIVAELAKMGAAIQEQPDGIMVSGPTNLRGARCRSYGDHRIAMSLAIAGLVADGKTEVSGAETIDVSFPGFASALNALSGSETVVEHQQ